VSTGRDEPMTRERDVTKTLTGQKVLGIAIAVFLVILTPNLILAWYAVTTFSGLIVPNSYIASQQFNDRTRAQEALGWNLDLEHDRDAILVAFTDEDGNTVRPASLTVTVGRPTTDAQDQALELTPTRAGYIGTLALDPGNWLVLVSAADEAGTPWKQRHTLYVSPPS
jgi:nitrogen fixation protein FixH